VEQPNISSWPFPPALVPDHAPTTTAPTLSSMGLLATNRADIDDCLQCDDYGYRYLDMTLFSPSTQASSLGYDSSSSVTLVHVLY
jgi:hypothetical protein